MREFLHVDDMAAASIHVMNLDRESYQQHTEPMCLHINFGTGQDYTIRELAETIKDVVGFQGELTFDASKPNGTRRKQLDAPRLRNLGWQARIGLKEGWKTPIAGSLSGSK